jgi:RNA polymerase sigma-70 factor (family 1)
MFKKARYQKCVMDHKDQVYRYARYTLREESDAEDATQEVFIKLWNKFDTIDPAKIKSWLMRTTHNQCIDMIRKRKRTSDRHVEIQDYLEIDESFLGTEGAPWDRMEHQHLGKRIEAAVAQLPERIRSVFLMYEIQGLKYREIADSLDLPINTVKVNILRARRILQEELHHEQAS